MTSERFCHKTKTDKAYYYERYRTQHRAIILLLQLESSFPLFFSPRIKVNSCFILLRRTATKA